MQPARGQVEPLRIAANSRMTAASAVIRAASSATHSDRRALAPRKQQLPGLDAERGMQPPGIGKAGLAEDFRGADP